MSSAASNTRWDRFEENLLAAISLMSALGASPSAQDAAAHFIDDGMDEIGIQFAVPAVHHGDARPLARRFAELMIPEIELFLADGPEVDARDVPMLHASLARVRSVVAHQEAGTAPPPAFRGAFEVWWDGRREPVDPSEWIGARLEGLAADEPERRWIHLILMDWLTGQDEPRWQAAATLLHGERVTDALPAMRYVIAQPGPEKRPFLDRFTQIADDLDQAAQATGP